MITTPLTRPFRADYLAAYSAEHVLYEFDMLIWLSGMWGAGIEVGAPTPADRTRLRNALLEAFVIHFRNVVDFLYTDNPKPTDVVAGDFCGVNTWSLNRPPLSQSLTVARTRANKEIAHLTSDRQNGNPPTKVWDIEGLVAEIQPVIMLFLNKAESERLNPKVRNYLAPVLRRP
jgi:hypothetical protein